MEKIEQINSAEGKTEILQNLRDKIDGFSSAPFSLKAGLALVTMMASLASNEVNAEEIEQDSEVKAKFEQVYNDMSEQFNSYDWSAENTFIDDGEGDEQVTYDFPDFPQSGSGQFEMSSYFKNAVQQGADGEPQLFSGLTQQYGIDTPEGVVIDPEGESFTVNIVFDQNLDKDFQIIDAISDEIAYRYGQEIETERVSETSTDGSEELSQTSVEDIANNIALPIANWSVENVTDDEGNVTGYSVTIQPG